MTDELVLCGASFPHCSGAEPPEEWRATVNAVFEEGWDGNYRLLPRFEHEGEDEEEDHCEDGTWREMPHPLTLGKYRVRGAVICNACYVTLCILSPSGAGMTHELAPAIRKARSMDPADLPRIG
jgi:hypothetical protein